MRPLATLESDDVAQVQGVFFDLDDTLLSHGVLTQAAYDALWSLHTAGIRLVAVTGRPSGWAEVFVRMWPIDGAVTENGAVFVTREGKGVQVSAATGRAQLDSLREVVRAKLGINEADDVHARRSDVTWDIGERFSEPEDRIRALQSLIVANGARTTRSSVHVHATFSPDDKASGAIRFARERFQTDPGTTLARWAFLGDSPNDAACFSALRLTFGVANVRAFASKMSVPPRWISPSERGAGFAEIARAILEKRAEAR